ncbi:MAG: hypothetical protein ACI4I6_06445 [Hominimerdicola sp.]
MDSYSEFFNYFNISKEQFYEWGISATIFPPISKVHIEWEDLKRRIFNNETVYIRGYGRDAHGTQLYKDFYATIFENYSVKKDPSNNFAPTRLIQKITELKKNKDIFNYQISHIWGHTKNIFLFEAPWNICYTPKIIDPFTGHEAMGIYPDEYQKLFLSKTYKKYECFIEDYNNLIIKNNVLEKIEYYIDSLKNVIPEKELIQFSKDVKEELSLIEKVN